MADPQPPQTPREVTCPFDNLLNFRDVGKFTNEASGKKLLKEGLLFRSARPDDATLSDRQRLTADFKIRAVMDLRTTSEHIKQRDKRAADVAAESAVADNPALALPMKIEGIKYLEINLNGKGFERSLMWRLSFFSFVKLVFLMAIGRRIQAISILAREVLGPIGLKGLAENTLEHSKPELKVALEAFVDGGEYPILVHCTQGKDRTGLIVALILFLLGVDRRVIERDYMLSEKELEPEMAGRLAEIKEIDLGEEFARCPQGWVESVENHLTGKYGGVEEYLESIGVDEKMRAQIKENLKAEDI